MKIKSIDRIEIEEIAEDIINRINNNETILGKIPCETNQQCIATYFPKCNYNECFCEGGLCRRR